MPTIVTLTMNPALDKSSSVSNVVAEHKLRCGPVHCEPGGGGINVARAILKLGGAATALYTVGGITGSEVQALLDQEGLEHAPIFIEDVTRESFTVLEEATTLQYRFNLPGPTLRRAEVQRSLETLAALDPRPDYIVASGSLPPGVSDDFYLQVATIAREMGARLIVDTSGQALCEVVYGDQGVYLIKPNLRELNHLAGRDLTEEEEQEEVAQSIVAQGQAEVVVVSLGAAGVLLVSPAGMQRMRAPVVPIRSKIGAGDSMVAGITLGLAREMDLVEAVRFGVAAGAAAVMTPGTELCRRDDTERLYAHMRATA